MRIIGPDRYRLDFDARKFEVTCPAGTKKFSGIATSRLPKLYVISVEQKPIYVGVTRQSVRNRLRFGWNAVGAGGYYGYAWRHKHTSAVLDIWCHVDASGEDLSLDIETVEAEVVYVIRCSGQWPLFQTEIHFHPSKPQHRRIAAKIASKYGILAEG